MHQAVPAKHEKWHSVDGMSCRMTIVDSPPDSAGTEPSDGTIVVFSVSNRDSFEKAVALCSSLSGVVVLAGAMADVDTTPGRSREVAAHEGCTLANQIGSPSLYFETSALTGQRVADVFSALIREVRKQRRGSLLVAMPTPTTPLAMPNIIAPSSSVNLGVARPVPSLSPGVAEFYAPAQSPPTSPSRSSLAEQFSSTVVSGPRPLRLAGNRLSLTSITPPPLEPTQRAKSATGFPPRPLSVGYSHPISRSTSASGGLAMAAFTGVIGEVEQLVSLRRDLVRLRTALAESEQRAATAEAKLGIDGPATALEGTAKKGMVEHMHAQFATAVREVVTDEAQASDLLKRVKHIGEAPSVIDVSSFQGGGVQEVAHLQERLEEAEYELLALRQHAVDQEAIALNLGRRLEAAEAEAARLRWREGDS